MGQDQSVFILSFLIGRVKKFYGAELPEMPAIVISPEAFSSINGDLGTDMFTTVPPGTNKLAPDEGPTPADEEVDDDPSAPPTTVLPPVMLFSGAVPAAPAAIPLSTTWT